MLVRRPMLQKIASRFGPAVRDSALALYGVEPGFARPLDGFESFILEIRRPDGDCVLRIAHSIHRSADQIRGEVDWINHLHAGGVSVARALASNRGGLVEEIDDRAGGKFLCTAFARAPGTHVGADRFDERFLLSYGRLLGSMHRLAHGYAPPDPAWRRPAWPDMYEAEIDEWLGRREPEMLEKYARLKARLASLPADESSWGLIHQDAHLGNLFLDDAGRITVFDFDDCAYGHFVYDIALVLFYASQWVPDVVGFTGWFMPLFLRGYREEHALDPAWLRELPHFMKLREITMVEVIAQAYVEAGKPMDAWAEGYMRGRRERILADVPFIEFDWNSLAPHLDPAAR